MRKSMGCSIHHKALKFGDNVAILGRVILISFVLLLVLLLSYCQQPTYGNMYRLFNFKIQYFAFRLSVTVSVIV